MQWNELAQGVSSSSVYEFQAWARAVTYVKTTGSYVVSCIGKSRCYRIFCQLGISMFNERAMLVYSPLKVG